MWGAKSINNTHHHQKSILSFLTYTFFGPSNNPKAKLSLPLLFLFFIKVAQPLPSPPFGNKGPKLKADLADLSEYWITGGRECASLRGHQYRYLDCIRRHSDVLDHYCLIGCPKKTKSPNFGMLLTPVVFIG